MITTNNIFELDRKKTISLNVNGDLQEVLITPQTTLLDILRNDLGLTGSKHACGTGECGACTVLVDGKPVLSCLLLAAGLEGKTILTIEGLSKKGKLHPIQKQFIEEGAIQCGYCTPGFILMTKALLDENPHPSEEEIRQYIRGNICRCTGYAKIVQAITKAAQKIKEAGKR